MSLTLGILAVFVKGLAIAAVIGLIAVIPLAAIICGDESEEPNPVDRWEEWP